MCKSKNQKPTKLTTLELKQLKHIDTEGVRKKKERHVAHIESKKFLLEAQKRTNYRDEYDRLIGERNYIPEIRRVHGDAVAELASRVLKARRHDFKDLHAQSFIQSGHRVEQ